MNRMRIACLEVWSSPSKWRWTWSKRGSSS